jgi:hypothetical protein
VFDLAIIVLEIPTGEDWFDRRTVFLLFTIIPSKISSVEAEKSTGNLSPLNYGNRPDFLPVWRHLVRPWALAKTCPEQWRAPIYFISHGFDNWLSRAPPPKCLITDYYWLISCCISRCTCDEGYTGQNCESEYIPCDPSPCLNGGQCRQRDKHTYTCDCPTGKSFDDLLIFHRSH